MTHPLALHVPFLDQSIVLVVIGVVILGVPAAVAVGLWVAFRRRR